MTDALLSSFRDDLANYVRQKEIGRDKAWELLDEDNRDYWRGYTRPLLEFLAD